MKRGNAIILGFVVCLLVYLLSSLVPLEEPGKRCLAIVGLMVTWWVTEAAGLAVVALVPVVTFPLLGITTLKEATDPYSSPIVFLFLGGFILGIALEKWKLHIRIALHIIRFTGTQSNKIILGFMLSTGFLSMWISNVAATVMMLPVAISILEACEENKNIDRKNFKRFAFSLIVSIAYAANIGGIATIVGTPPNAVMIGFINETYERDVSFAQWMAVGLPFSVLLLISAYYVLVKLIFPNNLGPMDAVKGLLDHKIKELGRLGTTEKRVLIIFVITAFLWIFRSLVNDILPIKLTDPITAILMSIVIFMTPVKKNGGFLLEWQDTQKLPWGMLLLFGGALSMAGALMKTGAVDWIGTALSSTANAWGIFWILIIVIVSMIFLTELLSNLALTTVFLPIVAGIAAAMSRDIMLFAVPMTMAASCCFMMPIATPANAVVFGSGYLKVPDMVRVGFFVNLAAIIILIIMTNLLIPIVF